VSIHTPVNPIHVSVHPIHVSLRTVASRAGPHHPIGAKNL
jgi:hypothetical protein